MWLWRGKEDERDIAHRSLHGPTPRTPQHKPTKQRGAMVSILDVENVGIMDLRGDALEFLKAASKVGRGFLLSCRSGGMGDGGWGGLIWGAVTYGCACVLMSIFLLIRSLCRSCKATTWRFVSVFVGLLGCLPGCLLACSHACLPNLIHHPNHRQRSAGIMIVKDRKSVV